MNNLQNNIRYKFFSLSVLSIPIISFIICIFKMVFPLLAHRLYFTSSYFSWIIMDAAYDVYIESHSTGVLIKMIAYIVLILATYVILWAFSKKSIYCVVGAAVLYCLDSAACIYDTSVLRSNAYLVLAIVFKALVVIVMIISIYYGIMGRKIELEIKDEDSSPDLKFINPEYSVELRDKERTLTITREYSRTNRYIYMQCVLDGQSLCFLKNGESAEIRMDANSHTLMIIAHYAFIKPIVRKIEIGDENVSCDISIKRKYFLIKIIDIQKTV